MKFLLDANMPRCSIRVVRDRGHAVDFARDIGLGRADDAEIASYAKTRQMALITRDFDFSDIRNYPPGLFHGFVVLELPDEAVASEICELLAAFLDRAGIETELPGASPLFGRGAFVFVHHWIEVAGPTQA